MFRFRRSSEWCCNEQAIRETGDVGCYATARRVVPADVRAGAGLLLAALWRFRPKTSAATTAHAALRRGRGRARGAADTRRRRQPGLVRANLRRPLFPDHRAG